MALIAPHDYHDAGHLAAIRRSMEADGWIGAPLVVYGKQLLSGTHRYLACKSLRWRECDIPTVTIQQIFAESGIDFAMICRQYGVDPRLIKSPYPSTRRQALADYLNYIQHVLPRAVLDKYGLDLD